MGNVKERNHLIDVLRGIAAINIIFIHTVFWSGTSYVPDFMRNIALFLDVPFFFFLAGWSFSYSDKWENVIKKSVELYVMTFITIIISYIIAILLGDFTTNQDLIEGMIKLDPVRFQTVRVFYSSLWFLRVFIPISILFSIILPIIKKKQIVSQFLFMLFVIYFISFFNGNFWIFSNSFWFHSIFYSIGYFSKDIRLSLKQLLLYLVPVIFLLSFLTFSNYNFDMQAVKFPPAPLYLIISMVSVMISLYLKNYKFRLPMVELVGNNAMYSYLMQGFSSTFIIYIVGYFKINWIIKLPIIFLINLILAILLVYIYKNIFTVISNNYNKVKRKVIGELKCIK